MQRHELISALGELRLRGMAAAFDEAVVHGIRQRRTVEEILGELLRAEAAERQSRSMTTNLDFADWPQIFGDARMTAALLDRLTHHRDILETGNESYRLRTRS